jgi:hypothetical protein
MQDRARNDTKSASKNCMQNLHARNSKMALHSDSARNETKRPLGINYLIG